MRCAKAFKRETRVHLVREQTSAAERFYFDEAVPYSNVETVR
jgi:hypothetical protein